VSSKAREAERRAARLDEALVRAGRFGREYCRALSDLTDDWVIDIFDRAMQGHPPGSGRVALLAVGGYGRGELAPGSDLDLLLVHDAKPKKVSADIEPTASAIWYPLWDAGVKLGHGVRRIDEQLDLARTDLDSATAIVTARPLAGDDRLAEEVVLKGRELWRSNAPRFLGQLPPLHPRTSGPNGIEVTPFVFLTEVTVEATCGPEALAAFWLPLETAAAGAFDSTYTYPDSGMTFPSWTYDGHVIWGLTWRILGDVLAVGRSI